MKEEKLYRVKLNEQMSKELTKEDIKEVMTLSMDTLSSRLNELEHVYDASLNTKDEELVYKVDSGYDEPSVHRRVTELVEKYIKQARK